MTRRSRWLMLAALCGGAFLVGVELMITAVALPRIVPDLADWTQLRRASWIINGYLLAYIAAMPLAGRAADRYGVSRVFGVALVLFAVGSVLAGAAQDLDQLIAARVVQGVGGGAVVPVATAGASLLFEGPARARALGMVGALTFLGMAAGPFAGSVVLERIELDAALAGLGAAGPVAALAAPSWRWVFYLGAPVALLFLVYAWAAAPGWTAERRREPIDVVGAALFTVALAAGLLAVTTSGEDPAATAIDPLMLAAVCVVATGAALLWFRRAAAPFLELRFFRRAPFSGAVLLSVLTGYGLATAIVGGAVFVDRVRYGGPEDQRLVLGALAAAMAAGALASGFALRRIPPVPLTLAGLAASAAALVLLSGAGPVTALPLVAGALAAFGFGFGVTVTPRSAAAVESVGRGAFGVASAAVTVGRMLGMAVGLAILTALGSNRIAQLNAVVADAAARDAVLPPALRGRPLDDGLVVEALERWASLQAAGILGELFLVSAVVTAAAALPALALSRGGRTTPGESVQTTGTLTSGDDGDDSRRTAPAL